MPPYLPRRHSWIIAPFRLDREGAARDTSTRWYDINAHRNLRGPYTAAGELVRRLIVPASASAPDLVLRHQLTLLVVAPELRVSIPLSDEITKLLTFSREGSPHSWTLRLANGLTDFLLSYAARMYPSRFSISFENTDLADPLDREFIAVLLRRADPDRLTVRVCSSSDQVDDPLQSSLKTYALKTYLEPSAPAAVASLPEAWRIWLRQSAAGWAGEWITLCELSKYRELSVIPPPASNLEQFLRDVGSSMSPAERRGLTRQYVESDCASDSLILKHAYEGVPVGERRALHRARAAALEGLNQSSLSLGTIPLHHEQAADDVAPLLAASKRCMHLAYYDAALDWARRGLQMIAAADRGKTYCELTRNVLFSHLLMGHLDEVEIICAENLAMSGDPALLAHTTYAKAILAARLYDPSRRDYEAARAWVEKSLLFTEMLPSSETRAVNIAFLGNTLALVEMRTGRFAAAHERLSEALDYMAKEAPSRYEAESAILLHNRARLHIALRQVAEAISDLTTLLGHQPGSTEAYFDRGVLHQLSGNYEDALQDYDAAIRWSPPYPEAYFNRAQTLVSLGRQDEALLDYGYVLTLAPGHLEALINRACLHYDRGNFDASRTEVETALRISPTHSKLLCLRGLLELKNGHLDPAYESFSQSIAADPSLADAWANRATVLFKRGDLDASSRDLTRALSLREDPAAFYNRGRVLEAQERWAGAAEDYSRALKLATGDVQYILHHLKRCQQASGLV